MLIVKNLLSTVLIVDGLRFAPRGAEGDERLVLQRSAPLYVAIETGQLEVVDEEPEPGDAVILDEVVGTGVAQSVAHGLSSAPSQVAATVTHVPALDYGGEAAKAFSVTYGEHTDTHVIVTVTSGVRFKLIVAP